MEPIVRRRYLSSRFDGRRQFSLNRLDDLTARMQRIEELKNLTDLCVYVTGSYARGEASPHSDIDLFFVHGGASNEGVSNLDQLRLFARIIELGGEMKFPTFSNDGEFLKVLYADELLIMLGGREDDYHNYFTARMLLLLESVPLVNQPFYDHLLHQVVDSYFRDYPDHSDEFRPVFLINDIIRFWKTLCLNYEHRRNKPDDDKSKKRKQQVKNFKLKFSRLMSCFGTIVAICAHDSPVNGDFIVGLAKKVPLDRFRDALTEIDALRPVVDQVLEDYAWFMENTSLSAEQLTALFDSTEQKVILFKRADAFGLRVFEALDHVARQNGYSRYLVM